jgi:hypothetical protein
MYACQLHTGPCKKKELHTGSKNLFGMFWSSKYYSGTVDMTQ